jgi:hypothetical protein
MRRLSFIFLSMGLLLLLLSSCGVKREGSYSTFPLDPSYPQPFGDDLLIELDLNEPEIVVIALHNVIGDELDVVWIRSWLEAA